MILIYILSVICTVLIFKVAYHLVEKYDGWGIGDHLGNLF